jgi:chorismate mutase/prephenate dehydratase
MGGILPTLDAFRAHRGDATIYAEVQIGIRHCLLTYGGPESVKRIHSKAEVFAQCRGWLDAQYPETLLVPAPSTSAATKLVSQAHESDPDSGEAAIGSAFAGSLYQVPVLFEGVEDDPNNATRFFVIAREAARPSGDDKTSIMFTTGDAPGALVRVLSAFDAAGVNLSHIDKRPSGRVNWEYTFFVDALGHREDEAMQRAIAGAREHAKELAILGSYPRSGGVL